MDRHVLVHLRGIAVDVDDLRLLRVLGDLAGHAVREAHAHRDDEVGLVDRVVRARRAVHARHAERKRVALVERAEAHQRRHHGDLRLVRQLREFFRRAGRDCAAAGVEDGAPGLVEQLREATDQPGRRRMFGMIRAQADALRVLRLR